MNVGRISCHNLIIQANKEETEGYLIKILTIKCPIKTIHQIKCKRQMFK